MTNTLLKHLNYHRSTTRLYPGDRTIIQPVQFHPPLDSLRPLLQEVSQYSAGEVNYQFGYIQPELYTAELSQASILGNSGLVVNSNNQIVQESAMMPARLMRSPGYRRLFRAKRVKKTGHYTSIVHLPWTHNNLFHWLNDGVNRLYPLSLRTDPITLIVPAGLSAFQQTILDAVLAVLPHVTVATIPTNEIWELERYTQLPFPCSLMSGFQPKEVSNWLRQAIWNHFSISAEEPSTKKLFIRRAKTTKRRILTEEDLVATAKEFGVEPIYAEDLSYADQVRAFATAQLVIGGHGAGFSNALFGKNLTLVELFAKNQVKSHYAMLAWGQGFSYHWLLGTPDTSNNKGDFTIDQEAFLNTLKQIEE